MLTQGATIIGIFGVLADQQGTTADAANAAGITITRRYGKWTYR